MTLPPAIPVMLLTQCHVFPHGLLPLRIFEERYRTMLAHALDHDRMFCIGALPEDSESEDDSVIHPWSTAGIIRACVKNPDGTSHLVLQGVERVRLAGWEQRKPFRIAHIEPVPATNSAPDKCPPLMRSVIRSIVHQLKPGGTCGAELVKKMEALTDPACLSDFIAAHLLQLPAAREPLLGMGDAYERLVYLRSILPAVPGEKADGP